MDNIEPKHQRRIRYKGTHPKTYEEKYKEHQPEIYQDTIEKVMKKGSTPAGMHRSICVNEILTILNVKPGEVGLDCTLGYGGHTTRLLQALEGKGHLYAIDVDPIELPKTKERLNNLGFGDEILAIQQTNFANINQVYSVSGPLDFVLADLGVSSMQIDNPERGFSFKTEGPLDLRMNPKKGKSAAQVLSEMTYDEIVDMLTDNSDEPHAKEISRAIIAQYRKGNSIDTTTQLKEVITNTILSIPMQNKNDEIKKACQRCFQALRIDVNKEFEALSKLLDNLPNALASNGRVAILTFHSGEDRLVKKSFQQYYKAGIYSSIASEPIRPSLEEQIDNPRSKPAKLRWAIKA